MPPSADVTPGVWGFVAFAVLAIALYLLMRNMTARMRRMTYRQRDAHRTGEDPQAWEGEGSTDGASDDRSAADRSAAERSARRKRPGDGRQADDQNTDD
ncbi:hypothetical protein BN12_2380020 [Nostocoides japonicum T1-X7]|uniref:Uncharacterized protein n=1 Tax=Nostocoides japonicum T1-X7 TaxID=1194083 RepID=A0A077LYE3_9MICO|nr:hypothetical protein [Tetrasphaera japonica]CCH77927.1 hypothetical protein BN12_2380020 [Tetrasphaera japonica T1-X7]